MDERQTPPILMAICQKYFPDITPEEAGHLIWNCTSFPFSTLDDLDKELMEIKRVMDIKHFTIFEFEEWMYEQIDKAMEGVGDDEARTRRE